MYRTLLAWFPIAGLLVLQLIPEQHWCAPVDPGAVEFVCGYDYARTTVRMAATLYLILAVLSFCVTGWNAYSKRLSKGGMAGLLASTLLVAAAAWATAYLGNDDSP